MTDYKKKKQLLEDNKDMYISEYDKNLSYEALSQIVDAKKDYANAAKSSDKQGMTKANNIANAVRAKYGSYTAGEYGDEYHPFEYAETRYDDYSSKYEDELDRLYDSVVNGGEKFSYDYKTDPAYLAYKSVYDKQGSLAYDRALAENSLKTGGMENSNAQSAAMQALSYYNSQLASMIPELYKAAYDRYYQDENTKLNRTKDAYKLISDRESRDYDRHLDKLSHQADLRDFTYNRTSDWLDRVYEQTENEAQREYQLERDRSQAMYDLDIQNAKNSANSQKMLYNLLRDSIDDEKWRTNYNLSAYKANYPTYRGNIGNILSYARQLFGNPNLTQEELNLLLGL